MKRSLIIAISIISTLGIVSPSLAQSQIATSSKVTREILEISPYNLVTASYQGRFRDRGIPSAGKFVSAIRSNKIKASDLVKVAVDRGRLSPSTLEDKAYLSHVRSILNSLDRN